MNWEGVEEHTWNRVVDATPRRAMMTLEAAVAQMPPVAATSRRVKLSVLEWLVTMGTL